MSSWCLGDVPHCAKSSCEPGVSPRIPVGVEKSVAIRVVSLVASLDAMHGLYLSSVLILPSRT